MPEIKPITHKTNYIFSIQLRPKIQFIKSGFKLIKFDDNIRSQASKSIDK